jgi:hypothetical protein
MRYLRMYKNTSTITTATDPPTQDLYAPAYKSAPTDRRLRTFFVDRPAVSAIQVVPLTAGSHSALPAS